MFKEWKKIQECLTIIRLQLFSFLETLYRIVYVSECHICLNNDVIYYFAIITSKCKHKNFDKYFNLDDKSYQPDLGETKLLHCLDHHATQILCQIMLPLDHRVLVYKPKREGERRHVRLFI